MSHHEQYRMERGRAAYEQWYIKQAPGWKRVYECNSLETAAAWITEQGVDIATVYVPGNHPWKTLAEELKIKENRMTENKRHIGRPNKATTLVPERTREERTYVVRSYHQHAQMHYGKAGTYAILCGLELSAAQDADPEYFETLKEKVGLKDRQISLYIQLANTAKTFLTAEKVEKVVALLEASPSELKPKELKLLTESVEQLTQGRSINDLAESWRPEKEPAPAAPETPESKARNQANWKLEAEIHWAKIGRELITGHRTESWTKMGQDKIVVLAQTLEAMIRKVGPVADQINPDWRNELKD